MYFKWVYSLKVSNKIHFSLMDKLGVYKCKIRKNKSLTLLQSLKNRLFSNKTPIMPALLWVFPWITLFLYLSVLTAFRYLVPGSTLCPFLQEGCAYMRVLNSFTWHLAEAWPSTISAASFHRGVVYISFLITQWKQRLYFLVQWHREKVSKWNFFEAIGTDFVKKQRRCYRS